MVKFLNPWWRRMSGAELCDVKTLVLWWEESRKTEVGRRDGTSLQWMAIAIYRSGTKGKSWLSHRICLKIIKCTLLRDFDKYKVTSISFLWTFKKELMKLLTWN
jgi:hypothetical protein